MKDPDKTQHDQMIPRPEFPPQTVPSYDLGKEFNKFTKKQQLMLEMWLSDPEIRTARQLAMKLKQDLNTVNDFIYHDDKCRLFKQAWMIQNQPHFVHEVDMMAYKDALVPGNIKARDQFYSRFGLISKDQQSPQVNIQGGEGHITISINPVKPNADPS